MTTRTVLHQLLELGQQIWLDHLSRDLLEGGRLAQLLEIGVSGITTNPSIFENAIAKSPLYREDVEALRRTSLPPPERLERLTFADVRRACDLLLPLWEASGGERGYVSLEVDPALAHDAAAQLQHLEDELVLLFRIVDAMIAMHVAVKPGGVMPAGTSFSEPPATSPIRRT